MQARCGGRPLDADRPDPDPVRPSPEPEPDTEPAPEPTTGAAAGIPEGEVRGLFAQLRATRDAAMAMVRAHIDLAKAEMREIGGEIGRAVGLVAGALGCLTFLLLLLFVGGILFLGEWVFGSIGWGLLLGSEALLVIALSMLLAAVRAGGAKRAAITAGVTGLILIVVLGFSLTNLLWTAVGTALLPGIESGVRPLATGTLIVAVIGFVIGLIVGAKLGKAKGAAAGGGIGILAGALLGAFTAITIGPRVGIALAIAVSLVVFAATWGALARTRIDMDELKKRFIPQATIDTTRETIEWAKQQNPLAPRS